MSFDVYFKDEDKASLLDKAKNTFRLHHEIRHGNTFSHFYTQRLQTINIPHNIDTGTSLKPKDELPPMTILLGVTVMEAMEDM